MNIDRFSPTRYRSKWFLVLVFLGGALLLLSSCSMSIKEARHVALEFQGRNISAPPRGLGSDITFYLDAYNEKTEYGLQYSKLQFVKLTSFRTPETDRECARIEKEIENAFFAGDIDAVLECNDLFFGSLGDSSRTWWKGIAYANRAFYLAEQGDFVSAKRAYRMALPFFNEMRIWKKVIPFNRARKGYYLSRAEASISYASGEMIKAEEKYREMLAWNHKAMEAAKSPQREWVSSAYYHSGWDQRRLAASKVGIARSLMWQGRLTEAEIWARKAIATSDSYTAPYCFVSLAEVFFAQGKYQYAEDICRMLVYYTSAYGFPTDAMVRACAREILAKSHVAMNNWESALSQFETIQKEMGSDRETFETRFSGSQYWGIALLMNNRPGEALEQFNIALNRARVHYGQGHYNTTEAEALLGMAKSYLHQPAEALSVLEKTVPLLIESGYDSSDRNTGLNTRSHKSRLIIETYLGLLANRNDVADGEKGFSLATTLQNQSVAKALFKSSARAAIDDPDLASLIRQRQDLGVKLSACQAKYIALLQTLYEVQNEEAKSEIKSQIDKLQTAMNVLDDEVKSRFPRYADVINPAEIGVDQIRNLLTEDEAFISTFVGQNKTFVWAFGRNSPVAFTSVSLGYRELAGIVAAIRRSISPEIIETLGDMGDFDVASAFGLYNKILRPVEAGWKDAGSLLVVADGPLGQLPLSVLPTRPSPIPAGANGQLLFSNYRAVFWLARTHAVTLLPSSATLLNLRSSPLVRKERMPFAGFGDPWFRTEHEKQSRPIQQRNALCRREAIKTRLLDSADLTMLPRLPETAHEVRAIALSLGADPEDDVYTGKDVSEKMVKNLDLSNRKVLVFATHGLVPGDLDGLSQSALALSSPTITGDKENDGLLTAGEVMGLDLNADWVVLSACNTATTDTGTGAVSGLGQAFFYAGAKSLLVTSWPVETTSAMALTTGLFKKLANNPGLGRPEALRHARLSLIDDLHGNGFSYAHPIFWAPFVIIGDGR